jgi:hypothetical protein
MNCQAILDTLSIQLCALTLQSAALSVKPAFEDVNARNFLAFCLAVVEDQIELNFLYHCATCQRHGERMFQSLPLTIREVKATEARLNAIYDAAKLGLKGDSLALAAGMLPTEYRQLCVLDPVAEMAEQKGRADGERQLSEVMHKAALKGDAKAALEILKHQHGWVAKQAISVEVDQRISIIGALKEAEQRIIDMGTIDEAPTRANMSGLLITDVGASNDVPNSNAGTPALSSRLRPRHGDFSVGSPNE